MTRLLVSLIRFYRQITPSLNSLFLVQTHCRFVPTCSHYAEEAVQKHGVLKGSALSLKRILQCQPWIAPRVDPIPKSL